MTPTLILPELESPSCGRICEGYTREARLIQCSLLPAHDITTGCLEIAFRYAPFAEVGGDFGDFFVLPEGATELYLGDVVGKGLPAALYAGLVMGTIRGIHKTGANTARVLTLLNDRLLMRPVPGRFCATLYARFDPVVQQLTFSNAGLPYPILCRSRDADPLGWAGCPRECSPEPATSCTPCSYRQATWFFSPPMACTSCAIRKA